MISPDRLERYRDFVDPEGTGQPYDPRKGLERLLGVLSPDPKGIVLAAMGSDWYGNIGQLYSEVLRWLDDLGLSKGIWPITSRPTWSYCERIYQRGEIVDGSLVDLGAVVKKAEDPSQTLYSRSIVGAELAVPLVQQAVRFVSKARESIPHKFDSMWRVIGSVQSPTDQRRPLAVYDVIDFLVHNRGKHRQLDIINETNISKGRLALILTSLGDCGIIDYDSPLVEVEGHRGRGWSTYRLIKPQFAPDLDADMIYQRIRVARSRRRFTDRAGLTEIIDYMKEHPGSEYASGVLSEKLGRRPNDIGMVLSLLANLDILQRAVFQGGETHSLAQANYLTHLFYDLVCKPSKEMADTLSPLPLNPWVKKEVVMYLGNYNEERSQSGPQGGENARRLLFDILSRNEAEMKLSQIVDLYNAQAERELKEHTIGHRLKRLLELGDIEEPKPGYYRLARAIS